MLQLKSIGVQDLLRFPYVTKPAASSIQASLKQLTILGAFKLSNNFLRSATITSTIPDIDQILTNSLLSSFNDATATTSSQATDPTILTPLGTLLSKLPLDPRHSKILVVASKYKLLHYAIMIVASMSVTEIFDDEAAAKVVAKEEDMPKRAHG